jgi:hypothetical protein
VLGHVLLQVVADEYVAAPDALGQEAALGDLGLALPVDSDSETLRPDLLAVLPTVLVA